MKTMLSVSSVQRAGRAVDMCLALDGQTGAVASTTDHGGVRLRVATSNGGQTGAVASTTDHGGARLRVATSNGDQAGAVASTTDHGGVLQRAPMAVAERRSVVDSWRKNGAETAALRRGGDAEKQQWFVMNAYKREQQAEDSLHFARDIEYFVPKHYVMRSVNGKKVRRLERLIPNVVFVRARYERIEEFKRQNPYLRYATHRVGGATRIMKVRDKEMNDFIRVARERENDVRYFLPDEVELGRGTRVRLHGGNLDGVEGVLVKVKGIRNKQFVLSVGDLMSMMVQVEPELIEIIKD